MDDIERVCQKVVLRRCVRRNSQSPADWSVEYIRVYTMSEQCEEGSVTRLFGTRRKQLSFDGIYCIGRRGYHRR